MKKILAMILVLSLVFALCGCGSTSNGFDIDFIIKNRTQQEIIMSKYGEPDEVLEDKATYNAFYDLPFQGVEGTACFYFLKQTRLMNCDWIYRKGEESQKEFEKKAQVVAREIKRMCNDKDFDVSQIPLNIKFIYDNQNIRLYVSEDMISINMFFHYD